MKMDCTTSVQKNHKMQVHYREFSKVEGVKAGGIHSVSVRHCKEAVKIIFMGRDCFDALQEVFKVINYCICWGEKSALLEMCKLRVSEV